MPDHRFFEDLGPVSLAELANVAGAELPAGAEADRMIRLVAPLDRAGDDAVSFFSDRRYADGLGATRAGACFIAAAESARLPESCVALITPEPQAAWARAAMRLHRPRRHAAAGPAVHPSAEIEDDVEICPGAVVGAGAKIGRATRIGPNAVIGPGVAIGRNGDIGPNASIGFALIGDRVKILSGAVIGEAGFGVAGSRTGAMDVPQLGRVIVQDGVTIGACTCIDRGAWEDTVIGENSKIDNLVQVAHNVRLGRNCLLAAHVGISGSVTVGDGVMFGGRAGIADHVVIGDGAQIAAGAGLMHEVPAGERWGGYPAKPLRKFMRESAWLARMAAARGESADR